VSNSPTGNAVSVLDVSSDQEQKRKCWICPLFMWHIVNLREVCNRRKQLAALLFVSPQVDDSHIWSYSNVPSETDTIISDGALFYIGEQAGAWTTHLFSSISLKNSNSLIVVMEACFLWVQSLFLRIVHLNCRLQMSKMRN